MRSDRQHAPLDCRRPDARVVAGWEWACATPLPRSARPSTLPGVSSLWTPEGEHRVAPQPPAGPGDGEAGTRAAATASTEAGSGTEEEALAAHLQELRGQLLATPVEVVVANHAYGLFELAAIHLSERPPGLDQARLAIDALGAVVEGLSGKLGEAEPSLVDALAQIRLAFVQIQASSESSGPEPEEASGQDVT